MNKQPDALPGKTEEWWIEWLTKHNYDPWSPIVEPLILEAQKRERERVIDEAKKFIELEFYGANTEANTAIRTILSRLESLK